MPYAETNTFGIAADPLGIANADWELQSAPVSGSKDEYVAKDRLGEFLPATDVSFNARDEIVLEYVATKSTAVTPPEIALGAEVNGWLIDSVELKGQNTANLTLSVAAHKHLAGVGAHVENPMVVVWPEDLVGFGAFDPFGASGIPAEQIQSSSYKASIEHVDAQSRLGAHLVGRSQGVKVEASLEAVTDLETVADPTGWKCTRSTKRGNDSFYGLTLSGRMYPGDTWAQE